LRPDTGCSRVSAQRFLFPVDWLRRSTSAFPSAPMRIEPGSAAPCPQRQAMEQMGRNHVAQPPVEVIEKCAMADPRFSATMTATDRYVFIDPRFQIGSGQCRWPEAQQQEVLDRSLDEVRRSDRVCSSFLFFDDFSSRAFQGSGQRRGRSQRAFPITAAPWAVGSSRSKTGADRFAG